MRHRIRFFVGLFTAAILFVPGVATAKLRVVTTLPDLAQITKTIGGDKVLVEALVKGTQDPHFVDARPSYLVKLNRADLLVYVGAELEVGWLPGLVLGARNPKILEGASGHLDCSVFVKLKEVPSGTVDRSKGDMHPSGNPHYLVDPRNGLAVARGIAARLIALDSANKAYYAARLRPLEAKLEAKIAEWKRALVPFKGTKVVVYHRSWVYLSEFAGFVEAGYVEPKIGIPPSPSSVASLIKRTRTAGVRVLFSEAYYPSRTAELVASRIGATYLKLPSMVGARPGITTYIALIDTIVGDLTKALGK